MSSTPTDEPQDGATSDRPPPPPAQQVVPPQYGAAPYGAAPYGAAPYGAPPYGAAPYGAAPYGSPQDGAAPLQPGAPPPQFGQPPPYGPPAGFGQPYPPSPHYGASPGFGQPYPPSPPYGYPGATPTDAASPLSQAARLLGWLIAALGALTFLFAFLPWATIGELSVNGIGGDNVGGAKDGVITLTLGVICVVAGLVRALGRRAGGWQLAMPIVSLVMGVFITLTALVDIGDISDSPSTGFFVVSVGSGLYLTLVAGIALVAISVAAIVKRR